MATRVYETSLGAGTSGGGLREYCASVTLDAGGANTTGTVPTPLTTVLTVEISLSGSTQGNMAAWSASGGTVTVTGDGGATYYVTIKGY